jgi:two-component system, LytTR family, response regulator
MIRTLIVDDEPLARRGIRKHLEAARDIEIIAECGNGADALKAIETLAPDLVFLDVQMPELDGFSVLEAIGVERMPAVIFVTAYDRFALRAFEVNALDYLLKPFDPERFEQALQRARASLERQSLGDLNRRLQNLITSLSASGRFVDRLVIKAGGRISFLSVDEIDWIEAADNYVRLHAGRDNHLLRKTMTALEERLDPAKFVRVHRSTIVNIDRIKELYPLLKGEYEIVLKTGARLASGRGYRERLHELCKGSA